MARWSVQIIGGKRTELLGYVRAADERKGSPKPSKSLRSQPTGGSHYRCSGEHWMVPAAEEGSLMARWRVEMFRKRLERLGTIDAGIAQAGLGNAGRLKDPASQKGHSSIKGPQFRHYPDAIRKHVPRGANPTDAPDATAHDGNHRTARGSLGHYIEHDSGTYRLKFADGTDMESNEHGQAYPARPSSQQMDDLMDSGRLKPDGHRYKLKNAPRR